MTNTVFVGNSRGYALNNNKVYTTNNLQDAQPTWEEIFDPSGELRDLIVGISGSTKGLFTLTAEGLYYTPTPSQNFVLKAALDNPRVMRQWRGASGGTQLGIALSAPNSGAWSKTFDFTVDDGGWTFPNDPNGSAGVYTPGVGWQATYSPNTLLLSIVIEYALANVTTVSVTYTASPGTNVQQQFYGSSAQELPNPPELARKGIDTALSPGGDSYAVDGLTNQTQVYLRVIKNVNDSSGSITLTSVTLSGTGVNPFLPYHKKVVYSADGGETVNTTNIAISKVDDQGYDTDNFNLGVHLVAADRELCFTTSYTGSFSPVSSGLSVPDEASRILAVRIPYRKFGSADVNDSATALHFLYGVDTPISDKTLFRGSLNTSSGAANEVDITPVINGESYRLVDSNGNQIEVFGGSSQYIAGFFNRVSDTDPQPEVYLLGSNNGGEIWTTRNVGFNGDFVRFVEPAQGGDGLKLWVAGADGVAFSEDGGETLILKNGISPQNLPLTSGYLSILAPAVTDCPDHECGCPFGNVSQTCADTLKGNVNFQVQEELKMISSGIPLTFQRTYDQNKRTNLNFQYMGMGWAHSHFFKLLLDGTAPNRTAEVLLPHGWNLLLRETSSGHFDPLPGSTSFLDVDEDEFVLTDQEGSTYRFNASGVLLSRTHFTNETWTYTHVDGKVTEVEDAYGRTLTFAYLDNSAFDDGQLAAVTDAAGNYLEFTYTPEKDNGVTIGSPKALLASVVLKDANDDVVDGTSYAYTYYGQVSGQSDDAKLNLILAAEGGIDETWSYVMDGDDPAEMTYTRGSGAAAITTSYVFPTPGNPYTTETTNGRTITHYFADNGGSTGIYLQSTPPSGNAPQTVLGEDYRPVAQIDAKGNTTTLAWENDGRDLVEVNDPLGNTQQFAYNTNGTLQFSLDAQGRKTTYTYGDATNPRLYTVMKVFATATASTPMQWITRTFDSKGRLTAQKVIDPSDGTTVLRETTRTYYTSGNGNGLLESITQKDLVNPANNQSTSYFYDALGRVIKTQKSSLLGNCQVSYTVYDAAGRVVASICNYHNPSNLPVTTAAEAVAVYTNYAATAPDKNQVTTYTYDAQGRRTHVTTNAGADHARTSVTVYDDGGRVKRTIANYDGTASLTQTHSAYTHGSANTLNMVQDTEYNARGLVMRQTDVLGNVTLFGYDDDGRLIKTIRNAATPAYDANADQDLSSYTASALVDKDLITTQSYDANGSLVKSVDVLGQVSLTGYDELNRPVKTIQSASAPNYDFAADPDLSDYIESSSPDQDMISLTEYNTAGQVSRTRDALGNWTLFGYDDLGRQVKTLRSASQPDYDLVGDPDLSAYPISSAADMDLWQTTTYDLEGKVLYTTDVNGNQTRFTYDGLGRQIKTTVNYVDGVADPDVVDEDLISETAFDNNGRVKWTKDAIGRYTLFGYDDLSRRVRVIRNASNPTYNTEADPDLSSYTPGSAVDMDQIIQTIYDQQGRVATTIDPRGNKTFPVYDALGRQIKTVRNAKDAATIAYESGHGSYVAANDPRSTSYTASSAADRDLITRSEYDLGGRVVKTFDAANRETRFTYDAAGRRIQTIANYVNGVYSSTAPDEDLISQTVYNKGGQVTRTLDARGTKTDFTYDRAGRRRITIQAAETALAVTHYTSYDRGGRVLRTIAGWVDNGISPDARDEHGNWLFNPADNGKNADQNRISGRGLDKLGRVISSTDALGNTRRTTYAKDGSVISTTDPLGVVTRFCQDKLRRVTRTVQNFVAQGQDPVLWRWHSSRWETSTGSTIQHGANHDRNVITDVRYDRAGRRISQRDPRGYLTTYSYDNLDRRTSLTNPLSHTWATTYAYVGGGNKVTVNDPMDQDTERIFDRAGRLINLNYLAESPKLTPDVTFGYDKLGNRLSMIEKTAPSTTVRGTTYAYDDMNRLLSVAEDTDGDGDTDQTVSYEYDAGGLRTKMTLPGSLSIVYTYNERGQLTSLTDWDGQTTTYSYDAAGRVIETVRENGYRTTHKYDAAGHVKELLNRNGQHLLGCFQFEVDGRANRIEAKEFLPTGEFSLDADDVTYVKGNWTGSSSARTSPDFDAALHFGGLFKSVSITLGTGADHGICDIYVDDTLWGSRDLYSASAGDEVFTITAYHNRAHLIRIVNRGVKNIKATGYKLTFKGAEVVHEATIQYAYDGLSRLMREEHFADGSMAERFTYGYDTATNRTRKLHEEFEGAPSTSVTDYTYNALNQLTQHKMGDFTLTFAYDLNGSRTQMQGLGETYTYSWDRANRLQHLHVDSPAYDWDVDYGYNGLGQMIRFDNTNPYITTERDLLLDTQPGLFQIIQSTAGANVTRYVHGLNGILAQENPDGAWHWSVQDGLGSVRGIVDNDMQFIGSWGMDFGYTGELNTFTGTYLRARFYEAATGQFLSLDPLETPNRYAYVSGNPINYTDPSGYYECGFCDVYKDYPGGLSLHFGEYLQCLERCTDSGGETIASTAGSILATAIVDPFIHLSSHARIALGWEAMPEDMSQLEAAAEAVFGLYDLVSLGSFSDVRCGIQERNPIRVAFGVVGVFGTVAGARAIHQSFRNFSGRGMLVALGDMGATQADFAPMRVVEHIPPGAPVLEWFDEARLRTFRTGSEHAIVRFSATNERVLVIGGRKGILYGPPDDLGISFLYFHTHPVASAGQASVEDYVMLYSIRRWANIRQTASYISEPGPRELIKFSISDPEYANILMTYDLDNKTAEEILKIFGK